MYKEKRVKIQNSREIRESLIKIHYLWKTNTHRHAHTRCDLLSFPISITISTFHFSIFEPLETARAHPNAYGA